MGLSKHDQLMKLVPVIATAHPDLSSVFCGEWKAAVSPFPYLRSSFSFIGLCNIWYTIMRHGAYL